MTGLDRPEAASLASRLLADPVPRRSIARLGGWQGLLPPAAGPRGPVGLPPQAGSGSGLDPPPPPSGRDPRRAKTGQNPALFGPNFSGFLPPCGAAPRGGGGAPPTTLILLRNQWTAWPPAALHRRGTLRGASGPGGGPPGGEKSEKNRFFFADVVCREDEVGVETGCAGVAVGRALPGRPPPLLRSPTEGTGGCPQPPPSWRAPRR